MAFDLSAIRGTHIRLPNGTTIRKERATAAQLKAAAIANPNILTPGFQIRNGNVVRATPRPETTHPGTPTAPVATKDPALDAYLTDPIYQSEKADLDYERALAKRDYDRLMGVDGAKGEIWQNWQAALDSLTRDTRRNTSDANAGLSGANLAGSGIARKSLSDIGAEFIAAKSDEDTKRTRLETQATGEWGDFTTRFGSKDLASQREAINRWREYNKGIALDEKPDVRSGSTTQRTVRKPPPGMAWVKNPRTGKFSLQRQQTPQRGPSPRPTGAGAIGTVRPGTAPPAGRTAPPGYVYVRNPVTGRYTLRRR